MKTRVLLFLTILTLAIQLRAQPATGVYELSFGGPGADVYNLPPGIPIFVGALLHDASVQLLPSGQITGTLYSYLGQDGVELEVTGTVSGKMSQVNSARRISLTGNGNITGTELGEPVTGSESFKFQALVEPSSGETTGTLKAKVCFSGYGCGGNVDEIMNEADELLSGIGDWTLNLNVTNTSGVITGTAQATLTGGAQADFTVKAKHSASTGSTTFQLRGVNASKGAKLQVTVDSEMTVQSVRGKMFGQVINQESF